MLDIALFAALAILACVSSIVIVIGFIVGTPLVVFYCLLDEAIDWIDRRANR